MKVYAVFEESTLYERDNDGKCLVALYANEDDAMARLKQEADKVTVTETDTKDVRPWCVEVSKWTERPETDAHGNMKLDHECNWKWSIEEWEVL